MAPAHRKLMSSLRAATVVGLLFMSANATTESEVARISTTTPELTLLRNVHETLLQLQVTELALKNRRDEALERSISAAIEQAQATRAFALRHREELPQLFDESTKEAYTLLPESFGDRRFGIYSRLENARRMILRLQLTDSALGMAEETAALYNQILDNLYAFGISIAPGEAPAMQGILFGSSPQEARSRYMGLRYSSND